MSRRRKIDVKGHLASVRMLQEIARRRAEMDVQFPLFRLNKDETVSGGITPEERILVEEHNITREHMHFELGWPWKELPTATTMLKARRAILLDHYWFTR